MSPLLGAPSAHHPWSSPTTRWRRSLLRAVLVILAACATALSSAAPASALAVDSKFVTTTPGGQIVIAKNHGGSLWVKVFMAQPGRAADWGAWKSLGGGIVGRPQVISWGANHADVFVRGTDSGLYHRWWNGSTWSDWGRIGDWQIASEPSVVSWGQGRIDVFARGLDNALVHTFYDGAWRGWESLGGVIDGRPSTVSWYPGHLDVFARGSGNDRLFHRWFGGNWSGWEPIGDWQIDSSPAAVSWGTGHIDVYARGKDQALIHTWYGSTVGWQPWGGLGGVIYGEPAPVSWGPGHLDVFVRGGGDEIYHRWYGANGWNPWEGTGAGATSGNPAPVSLRYGHLDVYGERANGEVINRWFDQSWRPFESKGVPAHSFMGERACNRPDAWASGSMLGLSMGLDVKRVVDSQLGTFDAVVRCLSAITGGRSAVGLRMQLRYDSGVPDNNTSPQLEAFRQLIARMGSMGIAVRPMVSVMSVNFTVCDGQGGRPVPTKVAFTQSKQGQCSYPSAAAYQAYFNRLVDQVQRQTGRGDVLYTAWNEPDEDMFTLRWAGTGTDAQRRVNAAKIAGEYYAQAVTKVPASRLLAGEFASDQDGSRKNAFQTAAGQTPSNWAYHPYDDTTFGGSTGPFPRTDAFQQKIGSATLWLTEVGVKASSNGDAGNSLLRGSLLRTRLGATATRAILYDLTTAPAAGGSGPHESALTDDAGRARPVLCGLADVQVHSCAGNPAYGGDLD